MSKELLKNTGMTAGTAQTEYVRVENAMDKVVQDLCPQYYSEAGDVIYGKVKDISYYSRTTGCERPAKVLLPGKYDENRKYPVLYFLHGIFGNENSMIGEEANKLDIIYGNLVNEGCIGDAIVVFPNMYASSDPSLEPGFTAEQVAPYDNFINDIVNDLIPYIENTFPVYTDREHRGLIGFSMGGRETIYIGLMRSDVFGAFGAISPAPGVVPGKDMMMVHKGQFADEAQVVLKHSECEPQLFMICCGTKDSVVGAFPAEYHRILTDNGTKHLWFEVPEADHDSNAIRSGYYNFLIRWEAVRK